MKIVRALKAGIAISGLLVVAGCQESYSPLSQSNKHLQPISPEMQALLTQKGVSKNAPMLIRAYKQESEFEVWKQNASGEYVLVKTFPMCRWSGQLGPKKTAGDRQVPEGFYTITKGQMNPNSAYYLSFNVGYPNAYDRAHDRTGSAIMVHGACSSMGCFSMTDRQIADIYALARDSFAGGQQSIQMQSYPFRFSPQNLAKYRADPNMPFWKMLKEGSDSFEVTRREARVSVCGGKYVFNRSSNACMADPSSPVTQAVAAKDRADAQKVAELISSTPAVRRVYSDGDQHPSFRHSAFADASAYGNEVSRPDALARGPVEVAVADVPPQAASSAPARQVSARAGKVDPVTTQSIAAQPAEQPSFFRRWLPAKDTATQPPVETTAEAPKSATPAVKAKPGAPKARQSKSKAPDKTAALAPVSAKKQPFMVDFTAQLPAAR